MILASVLLAAVFGMFQVAGGQTMQPADRPAAAGVEAQGENRREVSAPAGLSPDAPLISFIDSPTAACYKPDPAQNVCYINWYYMSVSASPNYVISMTATINAIGPVARYQGFFQTSMYVPYNMAGNGFRVPVRSPGRGRGSGAGQRLRLDDPCRRLGEAEVGELRDCVLSGLRALTGRLEG